MPIDIHIKPPKEAYRLFRVPGTPEVYELSEWQPPTPEYPEGYGTRRHIPSPEALEEEYGKKAWEKVKPISSEELAKYKLISETPELTETEKIEELERKIFTPMVETPEMKAKREEMEKVKKDYETALEEIRENPWLSEAGRVGRERKLYEMAEMKLKRLGEEYKALKEIQERERKLKLEKLKYLTEKEKVKEVPELWPKGVSESYKDWVLMGKPGAEKWGEEEAYRRYLEELRKEKKKKKETKVKEVLSQSTLNRLAIAGVPKDVALGIQGDLLAGYSLEAIRTNLASQFGKEKGFGYLDRFMEVMEEKGKTSDLFRILFGR